MRKNNRLEQVLSTRRYLAGNRVTLSDVRVFPSLVRFDEVYNVYFKCNKKRLADYPNILNYVRDLYQSHPEGFAATTDMDHIRVRKMAEVVCCLLCLTSVDHASLSERKRCRVYSGYRAITQALGNFTFRQMCVYVLEYFIFLACFLFVLSCVHDLSYLLHTYMEHFTG